MEVDYPDPPLYVTSPVGVRVLLNRASQACELENSKHHFTFDFIFLDMSSLDVILEMDWLSAVHATIDCCRRMVEDLHR